MDYTPLEKLVGDLQSHVSSLKTGKMNSDEVSELVKAAREVYERLVVLEFQVLEKRKNTSIAEEAQPFKIETGGLESQISIGEPARELVKEELSVSSKLEETPINNEFVSEETSNDNNTDDSIDGEKEKKTNESGDGSESIAERFENAPIEDISKSISLNEKFQFIRVLCQNNSKTFENLLEKINSSVNEESALNLLSSSIPEPESDDDKNIYEKFVELIKRRF